MNGPAGVHEFALRVRNVCTSFRGHHDLFHSNRSFFYFDFAYQRTHTWASLISALRSLLTARLPSQ